MLRKSSFGNWYDLNIQHVHSLLFCYLYQLLELNPISPMTANVQNISSKFALSNDTLTDISKYIKRKSTFLSQVNSLTTQPINLKYMYIKLKPILWRIFFLFQISENLIKNRVI